MPKSTQEEKYRWIRPILDREISIKDMVKVCPFCERTIKYWLGRYRKEGMKGLENRSRRPYTQPNETPIRIRERIVELRKEKNVCALKLQWSLAEEGIDIHFQTIQRVIRKEGLTRKYRTKKIRYEYIKIQRKPGELVEIDIKYVPGRIAGKRYYQYTAIDVASRWRYMKIYPEQSGWNSESFLQEVIDRFPYIIQAVKTDNGFVFTNRYLGTYKRLDRMPRGVHVFDRFCNRKNIVHYLIDPGKPAQNGTVERSHRSDQEKFYNDSIFKSFEELRLKMRLWNMEYNDTKHCGLKGLTPNEALRSGVQNVCI